MTLQQSDCLSKCSQRLSLVPNLHGMVGGRLQATRLWACFCASCLVAWLQRTMECPVCRSAITNVPIQDILVNNLVENTAEKHMVVGDALDDLQNRLKTWKHEVILIQL